MTESIIVALIGGLAVAIPNTLANVINSKKNNELITYQINELAEKVEKHNGLVERMVIVEQSTKSAHKRLDNLIDHMKIETED